MRITFKLLILFLSLTPAYTSAQGYIYSMSWENPASHIYQISLTADASEGATTTFRLPAWRPGRYIIQNYAAGISHVEAKDDMGNALNWEQTGIDAWEVKNPEEGSITISYHFYANVMDAGSSVLNSAEAYFNGSNLFIYVENRLDVSCDLFLPSLPADWKVASSLLRGDKYNHFRASSFHDFIDAPTIFSPTIKTLERKIGKVQYYIHFQGNFLGDAETDAAILDNFEKIIREQSAVFKEVPLTEYHFIFHLLPYNYRHAVEHSYSASFTLPETVSRDPDAARSMYGITSHEFWHLWNVKRIRPAAMWPYEYQSEAYTRLHWFTEGVTDYYTDLTMHRAGLIDEEKYLSVLSRQITRLENSYGTKIISPAQSSFTSWLSGSQYANPHHRVSYYSLGSRMGLLLDLEIRGETNGKVSFDDVFRYLYDNYYKKGIGVPEDGIEKACETLCGISFENFFEKYIHGTEDIAYNELFEAFGMELSMHSLEISGAEKIGIEGIKEMAYGWVVKSVRPGSDAALAGIGDDDIILTINHKDPADIDPDEYFQALEIGSDVPMDIYRSKSDPEKVSINYSGNNLPEVYTLSIKENSTHAQKKLREDWLSSKQ